MTTGRKTAAATCPAGTITARGVDFTYSNGFLTVVPGFIDSITYHPNGLYNQITHSNGVVNTQANDTNSMPRPAALSAQHLSLGPNLWGSGSYGYDGAGNVTAMGSSYFLYDKVSRVVDGHLATGSTGGGALHWQTYSYDAFANLTAISSDVPGFGRTPVDANTNRATGTNVLYDAAGNQTQAASPSGDCSSGNPCYEYDQFNMMRRMRNGGEDWRYMYTADDERLWSYRIAPSPASSLWALRDLDGKVLREYDLYLTNKAARECSARLKQDVEQMKFTGHERDLVNPTRGGRSRLHAC
ncbi:MAG TPA: hypothetical protein VGS57_13020 [Thermoanaerobaculia bacterium]|nr:hypothetical protein [Thermoanaerobaculia bacterium]